MLDIGPFKDAVSQAEKNGDILEWSRSLRKMLTYLFVVDDTTEPIGVSSDFYRLLLKYKDSPQLVPDLFVDEDRLLFRKHLIEVRNDA